MLEQPDSWDPAAPTYQLARRDAGIAVDEAAAIEALAKQGVPRDTAAAAIQKAMNRGEALVQIIDADWRTLFAELDAAGLHVSGWMSY